MIETNIILGPKTGDIVHGLNLCRNIVKMRGGVCAKLWLDPTPGHPLDGTVDQWKAIYPKFKELLESQPYISKMIIGLPPTTGVDGIIDLRNWRKFSKAGSHNIGAFYQLLNIPFDQNSLQFPWMFVNPNKEYNGMVSVSRSERYQFGKPDYVSAIKGRPVVFLGIELEMEKFKAEFPEINIVKTITADTFIELSEIIAGTDEFIGGQGFPHAIAQSIGLKRKYERAKNGWDTCWIGGVKEEEIEQKA